jgi:hypothetical protein
MPKLPHEALVQLVRAAPGMVVELLRPVLGDLPAAPVRLLPQVTAAELVSLDLPEYRADAVIVLGEAKAPEEAFVVEVEGRQAARKRRVWPFFVAGFGLRFDCPVTLVIFALDADVAAWCREPIDLGRGRGWIYPVVIGPGDVPVITDPAVAAAAPELAVLSVAAHGREPGAEFIAMAALQACSRLDSQARLHYADFIRAFLGRLAREALGAMMQNDPNPFYSEEFRQRWQEERSGGEAEGRAKTLLKQFRLRGWTVTPELEARMKACRDEASFDRWSERVLTAATLDEVFAE